MDTDALTSFLFRNFNITMNRQPLFSTLALAALLLSGCASQSLYQWGSYEDQIYAMYREDSKVPFETQIEKLEADYQKARAGSKPMPPGYHAHLGYLYFNVGKKDMALQSFNTEKALFPESAQYMDRLIARLAN